MAVGAAIGHFVPSSAGFVNRFQTGNHENSDCDRAHHHDVPAPGESTLRKAGRGLPQQARPRSFYGAELAHRSGADVPLGHRSRLII